MTKIENAPKYEYVSDLLTTSLRAIEALRVLNVDLDELYEVQVEIGSPILARFSGQYESYQYVWNGECWRRVTQ